MQSSLDLVLAVLRYAHDSALCLKGHEAKTSVLGAVHLVPWQVHIHDVPKILEVVLHKNNTHSGIHCFEGALMATCREMQMEKEPCEG